MSQAVIFTEEELQALCREWQRVLRLSEWRIVVRIGRERDFRHKTAAGENRWNPDSCEALIRVLDPLDYEPTCIFPQDMEVTLVHELLHLHHGVLVPEDGTTEDTLLEQALHKIAYALVTLKRLGWKGAVECRP